MFPRLLTAWRVGRHETRGRITMLETLHHLADHEAEHCLKLEALIGPS